MSQSTDRFGRKGVGERTGWEKEVAAGNGHRYPSAETLSVIGGAYLFLAGYHSLDMNIAGINVRDELLD